MEDLRLGMVEARFAQIVWDNAPLSTKQLVELCQEQLQWKRTTTYTVLKKLCNRGIFETLNSTVYTRITKDQFHAIRSEAFVQENFQGSLPAFLAAFTSRKPLTAEELREVRKLIDTYGEGK